LEQTNETFLNREDIVNLYAGSRKALSEEDVEDLLECVIGYIKQETKKDNYAIKIGSLGYMHRSFKKERKGRRTVRSNMDMLNAMLVDICTNKTDTHPLTKPNAIKRFYGNMTIEEIEKIQNSSD